MLPNILKLIYPTQTYCVWLAQCYIHCVTLIIICVLPISHFLCPTLLLLNNYIKRLNEEQYWVSTKIAGNYLFPK